MNVYLCQQDMKSTGLRAGEEMDRATCSRKISSIFDHQSHWRLYMTGKARVKEDAWVNVYQGCLVTEKLSYLG